MKTGLIRMVLVLAATLAALMTATAASACDLGRPGATMRVAIGETGRAAWVHLPVGFDRARPAPLVLLFHGSFGSGADILRKTGLEMTADQNGFVLVAPDGGIAAGPDGFFWNIPGVPTSAGPVPADAADDVAFIAATIDWLAAHGCVDRRRVYATGFSGGGRMASLLGCVLAQRIAAIAPVVGLRAGPPAHDDPAQPDPASCRPARPMPILAFAGEADRENPVAGGGAQYWQYSMRAAEERWAALNRCRTHRITRSRAGGFTASRYTGCAAGVVIETRTIDGAGHAWVADNAEIWRFFARYTRR